MGAIIKAMATLKEFFCTLDFISLFYWISSVVLWILVIFNGKLLSKTRKNQINSISHLNRTINLRQMIKKNLSGIYYFDSKYGEDKKPLCIEDCSPERQNEILNDMSPEQLKELAEIFIRTLNRIGDELNLEKDETI